jgi:hypothetical protein
MAALTNVDGRTSEERLRPRLTRKPKMVASLNGDPSDLPSLLSLQHGTDATSKTLPIMIGQ